VINQDLMREADDAEGAAWADMFQAAPGRLGVAVERIAGATMLLAPALPLALFNRVIGAGHCRVGRADLETVVARFAGSGATRYFVHVWPRAHPSLARRLRALGFDRGNPAAWVKVAHGGPIPAGTSDLEVRPIGKDEAAELAAVICTAHRMPLALAPWIMALVGRTGWSAYGAFDGDRLVAGAMMWTDGRAAWLGLGGTLPDARRQGAQGALLRRRVVDARAAGARFVATETWAPPPDVHNSSLANMLRAGFVEIGRRANFARETAQ
jgi:hypothetical protein